MINLNKTQVGNIVVALLTILFGYLLYNSSDYLALYRYSKFTNRAITIGTTKSKSCNKSGCHINYIYTVNGGLYGGSSQGGNSYKYPNEQYYLVYSKDDPTIQVILPEFNTFQPINVDTLSKEYLLERMKDYSRTDTKEDWGLLWNGLFEVHDE